jgi:tRNA threonylcarbamoyl adenosine modification protein YeaZ
LPPEPLVLAFDTSAAHCAAALLSGDRVLDQRLEEMPTGQADRLMPLLEEMLAGAGMAWADLSGLGVGTGPGNFTGVRISVAAARGLALGLGIPAIGVTTFEALALDVPRPVVVRLDARRDQLYAQTFGAAPVPARLIPLAEDFPSPAGTAVVGFGGDTPPRHPLAVAIARIAQGRLGQPQPRPAPFYLRGADALPPSDPPPVILP